MKLAVVVRPIASTSPARRERTMSSRSAPARARAFHSASERSRYFSVTISRIGPTFCAIPPWTSTRLSCRACRVPGVTSSGPRIRWRGRSRPRLIPYSGSPSAAGTPSISLMPGHTPPESCHPPPEPPSHSPRIARAAAVRRSGSLNAPHREPAWPVARMQTLTSAASKVVETARRDPLGMSLTRLTISKPRPGPRRRASSAARL